MKTIGLLGTAFTMAQEFYKGRLINNFGLQVLVPNEDDRQIDFMIEIGSLSESPMISGNR